MDFLQDEPPKVQLQSLPRGHAYGTSREAAHSAEHLAFFLEKTRQNAAGFFLGPKLTSGSSIKRASAKLIFFCRAFPRVCENSREFPWKNKGECCRIFFY
jgi:hypothetical protein